MAHMFARFAVEDYASWRNVFDDHHHLRQSGGARDYRVFQSVDDPNEVTVWLDFATADEAKTFASSEALAVFTHGQCAVMPGGVERLLETFAN